ncbi:unnamed protein product [Oppiella nova]|uniref:Protein kinase domain-containing protein n=1 Tax=Oppiella nova TaxID=334625 RepID=A0A7R9MA93_9ACAR|nr:unnamed protein product [Oppiella nova]CAG2173488.1 unnamed protein product [Oppiella nova]
MNLIEFFISCQIFKEILECVQYLHELNPPVIHRDLKPDNILLATPESSEQGRCFKLCDFGLAAVHDIAGAKHTGAVGTLRYMAPEVKLASKYSNMADIYSVGIVAHDVYGWR